MRKNPQLYSMNILTDEDVTGFIVRESFDRSQGRVLIRPSTVAESSKRPGWVFPSGLSQLEGELQAKLPPVDKLIDGHTRFPLYARFLDGPDVIALREHHKGVAMSGVAALVGMNNGAFRGRMAMCPECMESDVNHSGYAIWRRLALMPGILFCHVHQRPLLTFCESCEAGHRRVRANWRPMKRCVCGGVLRVVARLNTQEQEMAIAVATMADQILRGLAPSLISPQSISMSVRQYFGSNQHPHRKLNEVLNQVIGPNYRTLLGIGLITLRRLTGSLGQCGPIRNPIQNLATIHAIFGGFDNLVTVIQSIQMKSTKENLKIDISIPDKWRGTKHSTKCQYLESVNNLSWDKKYILKLKCRKWVLERLRENPAIHRTEIRCLSGGKAVINYMFNFDRAWYDKTLPSRVKGQSLVTKELQNLDRIERLVSHIKERYEMSLRERPMKRITKAYLLTHARCESATNSVLASQDIQDILGEYSETHAEWKVRVARLAYQKQG